MPVPYSTLGANDSNNLLTITKYINTNVAGAFGPTILGVIWIVAFLGALVEGRQASRAFIFSSFIGAIISIIFALVGLLASQFMYFMFLMVGIGVVWYKLDNAPGL